MSDETQKFAKQPRAAKPKIGFVPDPVIEAYKKDVDRTLLLENLKLTVEQRFQKFETFMQGVSDLRAAGEQFRKNQKNDPQQPSKPITTPYDPR